MSKVLDSILVLKSDMKASWTQELDRINVWEDFKVLYQQGWTAEFSNRIVAFIVMAYDNESGWIELHKDRIENKQKIMQRLGGNLKDAVTREVIAGECDEVNQVVAWFIGYQQDWRWHTIMTCFQYHADMMRFANTKVATEVEDGEDEEGKKKYRYIADDKVATTNIRKGEAIQKAIAQRREGEGMWKEIQKDFMQLDTVLEKEGKMKATDSVDIMSHEKFIAERNKRRQVVK